MEEDKPSYRPVGTTKYENIFVGRNLINVQQSLCTLLQVLVNYAIVADCGESATQRFNFILTTDDYFQGKLEGRKVVKFFYSDSLLPGPQRLLQRFFPTD
jgi:hypothetical protein